MPEFAQISAAVAAGLIAAVWQGVLLAVVVALALRLLPAMSAAARSAVWLVTFALAVLLHFEMLLPAHASTEGHTVHLSLAWGVLVAGLWLACSLVRAAQLAVSAWYLWRLGRASMPVILDLPESAEDLPRGAVVCVSDAVDRPCVAGFLRPRILFPPALLASLSAAELAQVLLHETEHLRRGDDWTNLAQKLALVVFPLNPVLLWVERRLCVERELACDDRVLDQTAAPKAYAVCLTSLAEHTVLARRVSLALSAWERRSELAARVYRILDRPQRTLSGARTRMLTGGMMVALFAAAAGLVRTPAVVSFMPESMPAMAQETLPVITPDLSGGAHLQLTRASMPAPVAQGLPAKLVTKRRVKRVRRFVITKQPSMLLTAAVTEPAHDGDAVMQGARGVADGRAEHVPAKSLQPEFLPVVTYAAVRVPGGWLLFEL